MWTSKIILGLVIVIALFLSGCTALQTDDGIGEPASNTQTTAPEIIPEPEPEAEEQEPQNNTEQDNTPVPPQEVQETEDKLEAPYVCDDRLLLLTFKEIFGSGIDILRKPAPFGKSVNYSACNIRISGTVILQMEFHETVTLEAALESLEDEARQIESQLFESVKKTETIGNKGYSFSSEKTGEYRFIYVDDDPETPVFVVVRSLPGSEIEETLVRLGAETLEKLI